MSSFEQTLTVGPEDLDDLDHVNNVRYVQWIQDISKAHWNALAPSTIQQEVVWVVMRHDIQYKGAAVLNDPIRLRTYIGKSQGARSTRIVDMWHQTTGQQLIHAETDWCLLRADTQKPARIPEEILTLFSAED